MHDGDDIIAIDGPAGAGKSTVARSVAKQLGFSFLDTGAMYRAATWRAMHRQIAWENADALTASTRQMQLDMIETETGVRVCVDGEDVTDAIRSPEVTRNIHRLDHIPEVRRCLVDLQRAWGCRRPTVAEGRDIGTVVFPKAKCKIYLDASLACRAARRFEELDARGVPVSMDGLMEDIRIRDHKDMTREDSPLRKAEDAVVLDSSHMNREQVVAAIVTLARERL